MPGRGEPGCLGEHSSTPWSGLSCRALPHPRLLPTKPLPTGAGESPECLLGLAEVPVLVGPTQGSVEGRCCWPLWWPWPGRLPQVETWGLCWPGLGAESRLWPGAPTSPLKKGPRTIGKRRVPADTTRAAHRSPPSGRKVCSEGVRKGASGPGSSACGHWL